jgi:YD repeat-containing protein
VRLAPRGRRNLFAIVASLAIALASFSALSLAATVFYVYDELGRLVAEIDSAGDTTRYTYDPAGNLLSVTRDSSAEFRVDDFSPSSGRVGDSVTIFGAGFIANPAQNALSFNGTPATITLATAHSLVASVPSGAASGPITISNANGSAATVRAFTVIAPAAITTVSPSHLSRGQTSRIDILGSHLDSATAVTFAQPGFSAQIVAREPARLTIDLTVGGTVPFGTYAFSVTNFAGTSQSGAVTVTVTTAVLGEVLTLTRPMSVHLPAVIPGAPGGNAMSLARPLSVHLPALILDAPPGNALSVGAPVSVALPALIPGEPSGNALTLTHPLSVHLPAEVPGAPAGNALTVTQPASVSMP